MKERVVDAAATTRWPGSGARSRGAEEDRRRGLRRLIGRRRAARPGVPCRPGATRREPDSRHAPLPLARLGGVLRRRAGSALDLSDAIAAAGAGSLAAADGTFSVVQVVTGVPEDVHGGGWRRPPRADGGRGPGPPRARSRRDGGGTATIVLGYAEALAMARGSSTRRTRWPQASACSAVPWFQLVLLELIQARQVSDADKRRKAHYVVDTNNSLERSRRQVEDFIRAVSGSPGKVWKVEASA